MHAYASHAPVTQVCYFGVLRGGDALHSLLRAMHGLYIPVVVGNNSWPEAVKADFTAQLHKFMANLTETVYEIKGKTILYIPIEHITDAKASVLPSFTTWRMSTACLLYAPPPSLPINHSLKLASPLCTHPATGFATLQAASKQKDLVQRLESTILHWTRQIKEVVNQQDAQDASACRGRVVSSSLRAKGQGAQEEQGRVGPHA